MGRRAVYEITFSPSLLLTDKTNFPTKFHTLVWQLTAFHGSP